MERVYNEILRHKLIIICRKVYGDHLLRFTETLCREGIRLLEVTFDQSDEAALDKTGNAIRLLKREFGDAMEIGAGTVMTPEHVEATVQSGGSFIVSPNVDCTVIQKTKDLGLVSIPGAMTPSEIVQAYQTGADYVKLFPAASLGLGYAKAILAPISHIPLIATGGINEHNLADYLGLGFAGAGIGSCIADRKLIAAGEMKELARRAAKMIEIARREAR